MSRSVAPSALDGPGETRFARFDESFLRRLERLTLRVRRAAGGGRHGTRRTRRVGTGLEFADHRDYVPGDDPRYLDWNLYGRLGRLALRTFEEDEDLSIDLLVDASASMAVGSPSKLDVAAQLAAALAFIGLGNLDKVGVSLIGGGATAAAATAPPASLPAARGKGHILAIMRLLDQARPAGATTLSDGIRDHLNRRRPRQRSLAIVISDFYDPAGFRRSLDLLLHHRLTVVAIQVSAPEEVHPEQLSELRGDVRLRDAETGEIRELTISAGALASYRSRREALVRGLEGFCRERGARAVSVVSDQPFDAIVLRMFRAGRLLG